MKALAKIGFVPVRRKGSHVFLRHADGRRTVVPLHDEVNKSTLTDIIHQTRLTITGRAHAPDFWSWGKRALAA
jgi:predicted RNA binding protein YcfA (HicA-like mRNA interferase family)